MQHMYEYFCRSWNSTVDRNQINNLVVNFNLYTHSLFYSPLLYSVKFSIALFVGSLTIVFCPVLRETTVGFYNPLSALRFRVSTVDVSSQ